MLNSSFVKQVKFLPTAITLTVFVILCKLGFWQLDRAQQKQQQLAQFSEKPTLSSAQFADGINKDISSLHGRSLTSSLTLQQQYWLLDNKTHAGKVGYEVIAAAKLPYNNNMVLLNLGWIKAGAYRHQLPSVSLPEQINFSGLIKAQQFEQFQLSGELDELAEIRIQSVSDLFQQQQLMLVNNLIIFANQHSAGDWPQLYKPVVMPPEKHHAYALTWFLLALASLGVYGVAVIKSRSTK